MAGRIAGTLGRQLEKLRRDFGDLFLDALADPETVEILLNPDGTLWQERLGERPAQIGSMTRFRAEAVLRTIATCLQTTVTRVRRSSVSCLWMGTGLPGKFRRLCLRRRSRCVNGRDVSLASTMTPKEKEFLCVAIQDHRNILVTGSTGNYVQYHTSRSGP